MPDVRQGVGLDLKPNIRYSTYIHHIDKAILSLHNLWELV